MEGRAGERQSNQAGIESGLSRCCGPGHASRQSNQAGIERAASVRNRSQKNTRQSNQAGIEREHGREALEAIARGANRTKLGLKASQARRASLICSLRQSNQAGIERRYAITYAHAGAARQSNQAGIDRVYTHLVVDDLARANRTKLGLKLTSGN